MSGIDIIDKPARIETLGVVLRLHPDLVPAVLDALGGIHGVRVVHARESNLRLLLQEAPF